MNNSSGVLESPNIWWCCRIISVIPIKKLVYSPKEESESEAYNRNE